MTVLAVQLVAPQQKPCKVSADIGKAPIISIAGKASPIKRNFVNFFLIDSSWNWGYRKAVDRTEMH
jgi:hypothetical protein